MKTLFILFVFFKFVFPQTVLPLKIDDFSSTKSWWQYHRDGLVSKDSDAIINGKGFLKIRLLDPENSLECNVGISERQNIYPRGVKVLSMETRVKLLNGMQPGSWGWGFWKTAKMGQADNVAWFMEQLKYGEPDFSWSRFITISKRKVDFNDVDIEQNEWHVYKIVRDLNTKTTSFFIDGLLTNLASIAPTGRMAFHLWIDNQIYSKSKGIERAAWNGKSEMLVDYVSIYSGHSPGKSYPSNGSIKLFEKPFIFGTGKKNEVLVDYEIDIEPGNTVVVMSAVVENNLPVDETDLLTLSILNNDDNSFAETKWDRAGGKSLNKILTLNPSSKRIKLKAFSENTPFISDIVVLSSPSGKILINDSVNNRPDKNGFWKSYSFTSDGSPVIVYLSASASESTGWNHVDESTHNDKTDDDLKIEIDGKDFGWNTENSFDGNRQFGISDVIVLREQLKSGKHTLKIFVENKPLLNRVLVFQE